MKKLTKLTVALLTLVMAFSLCACGNGSLEKDIVGTWELDYDMGDALAESMGEEFADFDSSLEITLLFEFDKDGEYVLSADEDEFKDNFEKWVDDFSVFGANYMYDMYYEMGYSKEDVDAMMIESYGMDVEEMLRSTFEEEMDLDALLADMVTEGEYEIDGDILSMDGDEYEISISGNKMTMDSEDEDEIVPGLSFPLELKRQ